MYCVDRGSVGKWCLRICMLQSLYMMTFKFYVLCKNVHPMIAFANLLHFTNTDIKFASAHTFEQVCTIVEVRMHVCNLRIS